MGWDNITTEKQSSNKVNFAKLEESSLYEFRALDEAPYSRYPHWIPQTNNG